MNEIIMDYYKAIPVADFLLKQKMDKFARNPDIAEEFAFWIKNGKYKSEDPITIEGYTASDIGAMSKYMLGEGSFMLLIELRENLEKALKRISEGFKEK